jgi:hypothetical protein
MLRADRTAPHRLAGRKSERENRATAATSPTRHFAGNFGLHGTVLVYMERLIHRRDCREAQVREGCGSTVTRAGQVAVLVAPKAALHCLRVAAPEGEGQSLDPPPACRRQSPIAGRRREGSRENGSASSARDDPCAT